MATDLQLLAEDIPFELPVVVAARFNLHNYNPCVRHFARQVMLQEWLRMKQWAMNVRAVLDSMEPIH